MVGGSLAVWFSFEEQQNCLPRNKLHDLPIIYKNKTSGHRLTPAPSAIHHGKLTCEHAPTPGNSSSFRTTKRPESIITTTTTTSKFKLRRRRWIEPQQHCIALTLRRQVATVGSLDLTQHNCSKILQGLVVKFQRWSVSNCTFLCLPAVSSSSISIDSDHEIPPKMLVSVVVVEAKQWLCELCIDFPPSANAPFDR